MALYLVTCAQHMCRPLKKSALMDHVPYASRGKWNAIDGVTRFGWSGSAVLGGSLVDSGGYALTFVITAALQVVAALMWLPFPPEKKKKKKKIQGFLSLSLSLSLSLFRPTQSTSTATPDSRVSHPPSSHVRFFEKSLEASKTLFWGVRDHRVCTFCWGIHEGDVNTSTSRRLVSRLDITPGLKMVATTPARRRKAASLSLSLERNFPRETPSRLACVAPPSGVERARVDPRSADDADADSCADARDGSTAERTPSPSDRAPGEFPSSGDDDADERLDQLRNPLLAGAVLPTADRHRWNARSEDSQDSWLSAFSEEP